MKKIGAVENNYNVYQADNKKMVIRFETENYAISLQNFKWIEETSFETTNYHATLVVNDIAVGVCHNEGRGGCSYYHLTNNNNKELLTNAISEVEKTQCYCLPHRTNSFEDVLDTLSCMCVSFYDVKTQKTAKHVIEILNTRADKYREMFVK